MYLIKIYTNVSYFLVGFTGTIAESLYAPLQLILVRISFVILTDIITDLEIEPVHGDVSGVLVDQRHGYLGLWMRCNRGELNVQTTLT